MSVLDELMWTWVSGAGAHENAFKCRWADCFQSVPDAAHLDAHLEEHVAQLSVQWYQGALIACGVFGCTAQLADPNELYSHVRLHIHQATCQQHGLQILRENIDELTNCNFNPNPVVDGFEGPTLCQWKDCGREFDQVAPFIQHLKDHAHFADSALNVDGMYYYWCSWDNGCGSKFLDRFNLARHMLTHSSAKCVACPFCGRAFASAQKLRDHTQRRPDAEAAQRFVCYLCNKAFGSQRLLRDHCERHVRKVQCPHCAYVASRDSDLQHHLSATHNKHKPYGCEKCDRAYVKKSDLTKHQATHTGQIFRCPHCVAEFAWQKQLKHHLLTHEPDYIKSPYLCHLCGSTYQRGSALSKHLRTFHKLTVPAGFTRFQFKKCQDNMYRLETERVLSDELRSSLNTETSPAMSVDTMLMEYM